MKKRFAWSLITAVVVYCLGTGVPGAAAQGKKNARAYFNDGVAAYNEGNFDAAAKSFEAAYKLKPTYKLLFNIAQAYAARKNYDLAIQAFERYLVDGGDDVTEERRDQVLREIAKLRPLVGFVDVDAPPGLAVYVNGQERGTTPLQSKIMVTVGQVHKVELKKDGKVVHTRKLSVFGGMIEKVKFAHEKKKEVNPEPVVEPPTESVPLEDTRAEEEDGPMSKTKLWGWVAVGTGAAMLAGGAITGILATVQNGDLDEACPDSRCAPGRQGEIDALSGLALTTDILLIAGGVIAATGIVLMFLPEKDESETAPGGDRPVELVVVPAPTGIVATLTF